jgi:hypothetical protein
MHYHVTNTDDPIDFPSLEKAITFVAAFYGVTREEAVELYSDEIEAYLSLMRRGVVE